MKRSKNGICRCWRGSRPVMGYILEEKTIYLLCKWALDKRQIDYCYKCWGIWRCILVSIEQFVVVIILFLDSEKGINLSNSSVYVCQPVDNDVSTVIWIMCNHQFLMEIQFQGFWLKFTQGFSIMASSLISVITYKSCDKNLSTAYPNFGIWLHK